MIVADLRTSDSVADWALARQTEKGDRFSVAVVASLSVAASGSAAMAAMAHALESAPTAHPPLLRNDFVMESSPLIDVIRRRFFYKGD